MRKTLQSYPNAGKQLHIEKNLPLLSVAKDDKNSIGGLATQSSDIFA